MCSVKFTECMSGVNWIEEEKEGVERAVMSFLESRGQTQPNHMEYLGLYLLRSVHLQRIIQRDLLLTIYPPRITIPSLQLSCFSKTQLKKTTAHL